MAISLADIGASAMKVVADATGVGLPLNGENILFPGDDRKTVDMDTWAVPQVTDDGSNPDLPKGGNGQLNALIFSRLAQGLYAREELAEGFNSALQGTTFDVKNYMSGAGNTTLGLGKFLEGTFSKAMNHEAGVYPSTYSILFQISES